MATVDPRDSAPTPNGVPERERRQRRDQGRDHGTGGSALAGIRVVELADASGVYCGKLLGDMGADVIKVERPGGDPTRGLPPFINGRAGVRHGAFFLYMNTNKRGVVLDLDKSDDRKLFAALVADADLLIETTRPGELDGIGLGYTTLARANSGLVMTSITGFGQDGPRRDWTSSDLIASALGGAMHVTGYANDPPVRLAGSQTHVMASTYAAVASMIALHHAARTGEGQHVDLSIQDAVVSTTHICGIGKWLDDGMIARRSGPGLFASVPSGAYRCKDGLVYLMVNRPLHWKALAEWIREETGIEEVLDPMFEGPSSNRIPYRELLDVYIGDLAERFTVQEMYHEGQRRHIAFTPVSDIDDVVRDPQLEARRFFVDISHPEYDSLRMPGAPYRHARTPWRIARAAPSVGEHDDVILGPLRRAHAASTSPPVDAAADGTGRRASSATETPAPRGTRTSTTTDDAAIPPAHRAHGNPRALQHLRVVEFTSAMAGPWVGRFMAFAGAEVIRVESHARPDVVRLYVPPRAPELGTQPELSPWFTDWNAGKQFIALDLTNAGAIEIAKRLVGIADIVVENQTSGVMEKLGLGYETLRQVRPDLIMLSTSGFGDSGPCARYVTWGPNIEALSGLARLSGFSDRDATTTQYAYPDVVSALHGLFGVLCALRHRRATGEGQYINLSQYEATCAVLGPAFVEHLANGGTPAKVANGALDAAPHGCYRAAGDDEWCAIAIHTDADWARFATIVDTAWARETRFRTAGGRLANVRALDQLVETWTRSRTAHEAADTLQRAGIAAGAVQHVEDLMQRDPHLAARHLFEELPHLAKGTVMATGVPLGLTGTPGCSGRTGARVGEDNAYVFGQLLGMSTAEIDAAVSAGAIETPLTEREETSNE